MTRTLPPLLALTGGLPALLRERDPGVHDALRRVAPRVGGVIVGAEGRPLQLDPVATAVALTIRAPGVPLLAVSDGLRDAPYNAARRLLTLDHLSGGRAGVVFRSGDGDAERTAERIRVIRALWNSWPAETLIADRERGVYATTDGIRRIEHAGAHYRVAGALNSPTSRQGEPVSIWHAASEADVRAAVGLVDVVIATRGEVASAWRALDERDRPVLAVGDHLEPGGAPFVHLEARALDDLERLAVELPLPDGERPEADDTLRARLGLPPRSYDLSDKPLAFGATA